MTFCLLSIQQYTIMQICWSTSDSDIYSIWYFFCSVLIYKKHLTIIFDKPRILKKDRLMHCTELHNSSHRNSIYPCRTSRHDFSSGWDSSVFLSDRLYLIWSRERSSTRGNDRAWNAFLWLVKTQDMALSTSFSVRELALLPSGRHFLNDPL